MKNIVFFAVISSASLLAADNAPNQPVAPQQDERSSWERSWEDLKKSWGANAEEQNKDQNKDQDEANQEAEFPHDSATTETDKQLNGQIRKILSGNWYSKGYRSITLNTNNGVVTISGNVEKPEDIQKVIDEIKKIEGVKSVNSHIIVRSR